MAWVMFLWVLGGCASQALGSTKLKVKPIFVCGKPLSAEIARSDEERARGLMGRTAIGPRKAMLFVFGEERQLSFWMKNVPFDIDIGFFDSRGKHVSHTTMLGVSPLMREEQLPTYSSGGVAAYAVEVESGFFKSLSIKNCRLKPLL